MTALEYITNLERKRKWNTAQEPFKKRWDAGSGRTQAIASGQFAGAGRIKSERPAAAKIR